MYTLKIEHAIRDFDTWKAAFDRDPVGRKRSGVRRYRICRPVDDPRAIVIDLDFDDRGRAEQFLDALRGVWSRPELSPGLAREGNRAAEAAPPRAQIVQQVETAEP